MYESRTSYLTLFVCYQAPADDFQVDVKSDTFTPDWSDTGASEQLTLSCHFTPLVLSTMTKYSDDSQSAVSIVCQ